MKNLSGYVLTRRYPHALRQQLLQELNRLVEAMITRLPKQARSR